MAKLYKLTDAAMVTHNGFKWKLNQKRVTKRVKAPQLCSSHVLHAYRSVELALLLNPIHSNISAPRLFEAEGNVVVEDWGKVGCDALKLTRELDSPAWYADPVSRKRVQVQFAVLCAKAVLPIFEQKFPQDKRPRQAINAAKGWLEGKVTAADAAADAAYDAGSAAYAAAEAAHYAAYATAYAAIAAYATAYAAKAAYYAAAAADAAADAYYAAVAANAAYATAYDAATANAAAINFVELAQKAVP